MKQTSASVFCRCGARTLTVDRRHYSHVRPEALDKVLGWLATDTAGRCGTPDETRACARHRLPVC